MGRSSDKTLDSEDKDAYTVEVTATDTYGETDTADVAINVVDVDEAPVIESPIVSVGTLAVSGPTTVRYAEGGTGPVATYSAAGTGGGTATWGRTGADASAFRISSSGVLSFVRTPDYETKTRYTLTVSATADGEKSATRNVTVNIINEDEDGMLTVSPPQPVVGSAVRTTLTDEDGGITGRTWRWASADAADGTYTNIAGATSASYTPVDGDGGKYLRVTVRYRDAEGSGKSEMAVTANAVEMLAAGPYDRDNNGTIDSTEVLRAVVDYFAGQINSAQVLEVVRLYFSGS